MCQMLWASEKIFKTGKQFLPTVRLFFKFERGKKSFGIEVLEALFEYTQVHIFRTDLCEKLGKANVKT